mmetsp:Transcript_47935/g.58032  ORF Transcript_47935/g.58032 Transcript_47935/m.58032 type:complete len:643 (-) Transcript_47935:430-2358(-)|eukprot:CAMPEP_0172509824 /NCGR_PEP_ID=MMETSP1066-20121228/223505_1 /TAXON_ID=671091 /ORGANISM="Coscinodiscus wailesii, Strain CCMP2513" /LENGTH=642 /DNA_ID=CAMNT_0013288507 /DNA_START=140 /DNA_END=2068 /DNA_ORIENTATION=+
MLYNEQINHHHHSSSEDDDDDDDEGYYFHPADDDEGSHPVSDHHDDDDDHHEFMPELGTQLLGDDYNSHSGSQNSKRADNRDEGHPKRWLMLFYMACLNLMSDWTCFSPAPISGFITETYGIEDPESLVVVFLYSNAAATLIEPYLVYKFGLRGDVLIGAFLLALGSLLKSGALPDEPWKMYLAFFVVGLSQPLYQCTPAVLSGNWFPASERTMATGAALNSNQLGIGVSYLSGTIIVRQASYVGAYMNVMAGLTVILFIGVVLQFESKPPEEEDDEEDENKEEASPGIFRDVSPDAKHMQRQATASGNTSGPPNLYHGNVIEGRSGDATDEGGQTTEVWNNEPDNADTDTEEPLGSLSISVDTPPHHHHHGGQQEYGESNPNSGNFFWLFKECFKQHGFFHATCAFVVSAIVINTLSTYMDFLIRVQDGTTRTTVGIVGALFQMFIMISSLVIGKKTDESRAYYSVILFLLVTGAFALAECSVCLDEQTSNLSLALLVTAILVGPLQPIATEIGVEVTYPIGENAVLCIQQLFANMSSAAFIPIFQKLGPIGEDRKGVPYTFSFYVMVCLHAVTTVAFSTYKGQYKRKDAEEEDQEEISMTEHDEDEVVFPDEGYVDENHDLHEVEDTPLLVQDSKMRRYD